MCASVTSPGDAMKVIGPSSSSTRVTHTSLSTLTYLRRMSHSEGQMYTALQSRDTGGVNMGLRHMLGIVIQRYHPKYFSTSSRYMDFARVTITWDIFIPGPYAARTKSQLNKQAKHTKFNNFTERMSFAEHWKLVAELSEFHFTLSRVHFFQLEIRKKKRNILSEKRENRMALKSLSLFPKAVMLTHI